ncbi:MAG: autotransporter-associated beta strand repeat-containing protein [Akkermansiaceae bacterium]
MPNSTFSRARIASSFLRSATLATLLSATWASSLQAQSVLYWDSDITGSGVGGSGTWDNISPRWNLLGIGSYSTWSNNSPTDIAVFSGTAGTVTLGANVTAQSLIFTTSDYTIAGTNTLTLGTGGIDTGSGNQTISAIISGSDGLTKSGTGTLLLTGANSYTGGTVVNSGTLTLGSGGSISHPADTTTVGNASGDVGALQFSGGTLSNLNATIGNAAGSQGSATVTSGTWTNAGNLLVGRAGAGSLTVNGSGLVTIEGVTTTGFYGGSSGAITLSGTSGNRGTLSTNQIVERLGGGSGTVTFDGGILQARINESAFIANYESGEVTIDSGGAFIDSNGFDIGISSSLSGTGGLNKLGAGTLTLSGANTYTGGTNVNSGTLTLENGGSISHAAANTTLGNGSTDVGTLQLNSGSSLITSNLLIGNSGTGNLLINGGTVNSASATLAFNASSGGNVTVSGGSWTNASSLRIGRASSASLTVSNGGLVTIEGITYTGFFGGGTGTIALSGTSGNRGTLATNQIDERIGGSGGSVTFDGGILQARTDEANFITNYEAGDVTINAGGAFIDSNGFDIGISSPLGGIGGLTKLGAGTLSLGGTNTYTSGTTVSTGTLQGNSTSLQGNIINNAALHFNQASNGIYAGLVSGSGSLTKIGVGTLTLSGTNTYTGGTTVEAGTLLQGTSTVFATNTAFTVNGGTLDLNDFNLTASSFSGTGGSVDLGTATLTVDQSGNNNYSGTILGTGGLTKTGSGTLTLFGNNTYSGGTSISDGVLELGHSTNSLADTGTIAISGGTLALGTNSDTVGALSLSSGNITGSSGTLTASSYAFTNSGAVSANLSGTGALTKTGSGTLTLSGANSYTGGTTLNAGTLAVSGTGSINHPSNALNVNDNATLQIAAGGSVTNGQGFVGGNYSPFSMSYADISGTWTNSGGLDVGYAGRGSLTVRAGGSVVNSTGRVGYLAFGNADISGTWTNSSALTVGSLSNGILSVNDGGLVNVGSGSGTITLANSSAHSGTLNINGSTNPGILNAASVNGSAGNAILNFNHSNPDYHFTTDGAATGTAVAITGSTSVNHLGSGTTTLSGTNTYTGGTKVSSGKLAQGASSSFAANTAYTVNGGTLDLNDFDLTASSLSGSGGLVDLGTAKLTTDQSGDTTYAGTISGTGGLAKTGTGTLSLRGSNTYSGGTTVNGGLVNFSTGDNFGTAAITLDGGGLQWSSDTSLDISDRLNPLGSAGATFDTNSNNVTLASSMSGSGSLTKQGSGTLTLSGINTYTGGTIVNNDTINFATGDNFGTAAITLDGGGLQWASGSTFDISNRLNPLGSAGGTFDTNSNNVTLATAMSGSGSLTKLGIGTLTLSGINSYTGGTTVSAGNLALGHATDTLADTQAVTISGGTLSLGANSDTVGAVTMSSGSITGSGTLIASEYTFTDSGSVSVNLASGNGLTKTGAGTVTLSGTNTYTGGTTVSAGTLAVTGTGSISHSSNDLSLSNGATLEIAAGGSVVNRVAYLGSSHGSIGYADISGNWTISENLHLGSDGFGSLTVRSGGIVSNAAGYLGLFDGSGTADISGIWNNNGDLYVGEFGSSSLTIQSGGQVNVNSGAGVTSLARGASGFQYTAGILNINGSTAGVLNTASVHGGAGEDAIINFNHTDSDYHFSTDGEATGTGVAITGSTAVNHLGTGTTTLSGTNTYTGGTTISAGTLQGTTSSLQGNITNNAALVFDQSTNGTYAGVISGTGSLAKSGTGTTTLSGTNTFTGATTVSAGTLQFSKTTALYNDTPASWTNSNLTIASGATLAVNVGGSGEFNALNLDTLKNLGNGSGGFQAGSYLGIDTTNASGGNFAYNSNITDTNSGANALGLTKLGTGTLTLRGTNSYTGDTTVTAGQLKVTGSASNSNFTVNGGRLSGTGTVGELTVTNAGTLAPGNSPGTLNASTTTFEAGSTYEWEINDANGIDGINSDQLAITGTFIITDNKVSMPIEVITIELLTLTEANATGALTNFDSEANYSWAFLTTTAGITFEGDATLEDAFEINTTGFQNTFDGTFDLIQNGNNLNITYTAPIPEPSASALILIGLTITITRRMRS